MKIFIAYDGSERADHALSDLRYAGLPAEAEVKIITVVEPILPAGTYPASGMIYTQMPEAAFQQAWDNLRAACDRVRRNFPGWEVEAAVYEGQTALEIVEHAAEWGTDLVVVSPLGRSEFERFIFGSLSRSVVEGAPCSVRVARKSDYQDQLRVLIGYDDSPGAKSAVHEVALRLWPAGAQVRLVTALGPHPGLRAETAERDEKGFPVKHREPAGILQQAGLGVSSTAREGGARDVIIDEAQNWGAHCIFLGRNDRSGFSRLLFGSVSAAVACQAPCSVEVVRESDKRPLTFSLAREYSLASMMMRIGVGG